MLYYHSPEKRQAAHPAHIRKSAAQAARPVNTRSRSAEWMPGLQREKAEKNVIQAMTMISYRPGSYDYDPDPATGNFRKSVTVGGAMHAELDPRDPKNGSTTGSDRNVHGDLMRRLNEKWDSSKVKGHLLNDHLGGLAVEENLFPISSQANKVHLGKVEGMVKHYVYCDGITEPIPDIVIYDVTVMNDDNTQQFNENNPRTKFECSLDVRYAPMSAGQSPSPVSYQYTVESDLSTREPEGSASHVPKYTGNIRGSWNPVNIIPQRIPDATGGSYELYDVDKNESHGTVTYGIGSYQASL